MNNKILLELFAPLKISLIMSNIINNVSNRLSMILWAQELKCNLKDSYKSIESSIGWISNKISSQQKQNSAKNERIHSHFTINFEENN